MTTDDDTARVSALSEVQQLAAALADYEEHASTFRVQAQAFGDTAATRRLRDDLAERAAALGALTRTALAAAMLPDRPQRTVRLLSRHVGHEVDLVRLASTDHIDPWAHEPDQRVDGLTPPRPQQLGPLPAPLPSAHGHDLRVALRDAIDAEPDVAAWLAYALRAMLAERRSTPDVLLDGRPAHPQAMALYALAGAAPPHPPGATSEQIPAGAPLRAEPHTSEALRALAAVLVGDYDPAAAIAHHLDHVLAERSLDPTSLVAADPAAPHAVALLQLLGTDG